VDWSDVGLRVFELLSPLLLAALTWTAARGAQLITAMVKNEYLRGVLVRVDTAILAVVREIQQVTVDTIKAARADGKLTPEERAGIQKAALDAVKSYLGPKGLAEITRIFGLDTLGVERFLTTRVEAAVHDLKLARASVPTSGAAPGAPLPLPA
jgi:hypothetical protein